MLRHPQPLYGSDRYDPVVVRAAEVCAAREPATARSTLAARRPRAIAQVIDGADHFCFAKLAPLGTAIDAWTLELSEPGDAARGSAPR